MNRSEEGKWYKLDNAAKIFPGTMRGADTRVFRIACELHEKIDPQILQAALDEAIREMPYFNCVLRKGLFWYYLDDTNLKPAVEEDHMPACAPLYLPGRKNLLYRVNWYGNRINLEMFHALADGTGGFLFLRRIVINYLRMAHDLPAGDRKDRSSTNENASDSFGKYYQSLKNTKDIKKMMATRAYQLKGPKDPNLLSHLIEGTVPAGMFLNIAHSYNTTAGVLIAAIFIKAVLDTMTVRDLRLPIIISVPVDLRQYFPSDTTRNFFGVISVSFKADRLDHSLDEIVAMTAESFKEQLTMEKVNAAMNSYSTFEHTVGIRVVPLVIKELGIQGINTLTKLGVTASVSNLGKIQLPESLQDYVKQFSAFMASPNLQLTIATYQDRMTFGFCSSFEESAVILNFFRLLTDLGISTELASNDCDLKR